MKKFRVDDLAIDPEIRRGFFTGVLLALSFFAPACQAPFSQQAQKGAEMKGPLS